jgi:hypothetical protein
MVDVLWERTCFQPQPKFEPGLYSSAAIILSYYFLPR